MVLGGFFDESERSEKTEPISLAGYIFKPSGYKHFCRKWARMLKSAGPTPTTHFHMTHLYTRSYEYAGWSAEQRAEMLRQAVDAVRKHTYCGISVQFSQSEFEQTAPPLWRFERGTIYSGACQMVMRATAFWMDQHHCQDPIAYAFESGHRFWSEANDVLTGIGKHPELKSLYRYHSHTAIDKENSYGLQAADMLAWTMTRMEIGVPHNHTMGAFAPIFMDLVKGQSGKYHLFHPTGDYLKRFFDEQMSMPPPIVVTLSKARKPRLR